MSVVGLVVFLGGVLGLRLTGAFTLGSLIGDSAPLGLVVLLAALTTALVRLAGWD